MGLAVLRDEPQAPGLPRARLGDRPMTPTPQEAAFREFMSGAAGKLAMAIVRGEGSLPGVAPEHEPGLQALATAFAAGWVSCRLSPSTVAAFSQLAAERAAAVYQN